MPDPKLKILAPADFTAKFAAKDVLVKDIAVRPFWAAVLPQIFIMSGIQNLNDGKDVEVTYDPEATGPEENKYKIKIEGQESDNQEAKSIASSVAAAVQSKINAIDPFTILLNGLNDLQSLLNGADPRLGDSCYIPTLEEIRRAYQTAAAYWEQLKKIFAPRPYRKRPELFDEEEAELAAEAARAAKEMQELRDAINAAAAADMAAKELLVKMLESLDRNRGRRNAPGRDTENDFVNGWSYNNSSNDENIAVLLDAIGQSDLARGMLADWRVEKAKDAAMTLNILAPAPGFTVTTPANIIATIRRIDGVQRYGSAAVNNLFDKRDLLGPRSFDIILSEPDAAGQFQTLYVEIGKDGRPRIINADLSNSNLDGPTPIYRGMLRQQGADDTQIPLDIQHVIDQALIQIEKKIQDHDADRPLTVRERLRKGLPVTVDELVEAGLVLPGTDTKSQMFLAAWGVPNYRNMRGIYEPTLQEEGRKDQENLDYMALLRQDSRLADALEKEGAYKDFDGQVVQRNPDGARNELFPNQYLVPSLQMWAGIPNPSGSLDNSSFDAIRNRATADPDSDISRLIDQLTNNPPKNPEILVLGGSLGVGIQEANLLKGLSHSGYSAQTIYEKLSQVLANNPDFLKDKQFIISIGDNNNPQILRQDLTKLMQLLKDRGVSMSDVVLVGTGTGPNGQPDATQNGSELNAITNQVAQQSGAHYVPPSRQTADSALPGAQIYRDLGQRAMQALGHTEHDIGAGQRAPQASGNNRHSSGGISPADLDNLMRNAPQGTIDRSRLAAEIKANPELEYKLAWMIQGETGEISEKSDLSKQLIQLESAGNRALIRGQSLPWVLQSVGEAGNRGYYANATYRQGARPNEHQMEIFRTRLLAPFLAGSDESTRRLGFTATGNASGGVARNGIARGDYAGGYSTISGETYAFHTFDYNRSQRNPLPRVQLPTVASNNATATRLTPTPQTSPPNVAGLRTNNASLPAPQPSGTNKAKEFAFSSPTPAPTGNI
jgi:hypothetical protein